MLKGMDTVRCPQNLTLISTGYDVFIWQDIYILNPGELSPMFYIFRVITKPFSPSLSRRSGKPDDISTLNRDLDLQTNSPKLGTLVTLPTW